VQKSGPETQLCEENNKPQIIARLMKSKRPEIHGHLQITHDKCGVFIGGDPEGFQSLAKLLVWFARVDQDKIPFMPDGEREHTHLSPGTHLSKNSLKTEICRLDAKGTGIFPPKYDPA